MMVQSIGAELGIAGRRGAEHQKTEGLSTSMAQVFPLLAYGVDIMSVLFDILGNELILYHIAPYLGVQALLSVSALSKSFNELILRYPSVFRHVDLSMVRSISKPLWRLDDDSCEEDYYSKPLDQVLSVFGSQLKYTRTLILDRLHLSFKCLMYLLGNFNIQILSIQDVSTLSDTGVRNALRYLMRPDRVGESMSLRALYYFRGDRGTSEAEQSFRNETVINEYQGVTQRSGATLGSRSLIPTSSKAANDPFSYSVYATFGVCKASARALDWDDWALLLAQSRASVAFDMVLCPHDPSLRPGIATVRLAGCHNCGACPEEPAYPTSSVSLPGLIDVSSSVVHLLYNESIITEESFVLNAIFLWPILLH